MKLDISIERSTAGSAIRDHDIFIVNIEVTRKELLELSCQDGVPWKRITDIFDAMLSGKRPIR